MTLKEIVDSESINIDQLQKGLKNIGLDFSRFENIENKQIPELISLFKVAVNVNSQKTDKFTKIDLRTKFDKILKAKNVTETKINEVHLTEIDLKETTHLGKIESKTQTGQQNQKSEAVKNNNYKLDLLKYGKVKFFDENKGFGYLHSFDDEKDCFIHASKIITSPVREDDMVVFQTIKSRKKEGELDAIKVSSHIPVFIFNKESYTRSNYIILLDNHIESTDQLTIKLDTCFAIAEINKRPFNSNVNIIDSLSVDKPDKIKYGKKILQYLLNDLRKNKTAINFLSELLKGELAKQELDNIYSNIINQFNLKSITEVNAEIEIIKGITYFNDLLEDKCKGLNLISFVLWCRNDLDILPNPSNQIEDEIWRDEILPSLDWMQLQDVLMKLLSESGASNQVETSYKYLIEKGWQINTTEELKDVVSFLNVFKDKFPDIKLSEENFTATNNYIYIHLFKNGIIDNLSDEKIIRYIDSLESEETKAVFIESLPQQRASLLYTNFPSLSDYHGRYAMKIVEKDFDFIDYICFDLESDGERIREFAWKTKTGHKSDSDFIKKEDGISELVRIINADTIVIGHNIKEFDLQILSEQGASPGNYFVWDTLEVEMLLDPHRFSYGLKTEHNAVSDVELTFRLFKNQISRIIASKSEYESTVELLPFKGVEVINLIACNPNWKFLNEITFEKQSDDFFRPNPLNQNISEQTFLNLKEKIDEDGKKVIIAPELIWDTLSHQFNITFYSENKSLTLYLSKEKIESTLADNKLLKTILIRFVDSCISRKVVPYFQHMPVALRMKVTPEQVVLICDNNEDLFDNQYSSPICIKPTDIDVLKKLKDSNSDLKVIIIGHELYNLTSKVQLGQIFDFTTIFERLKNEPIWLQMSGGKGFISLEKKHCELLGINEFPEYLQNIWLEKIGNGKFKVWCNINFDKCINDFQFDVVSYIAWIDDSIIKENSFIVRPDVRRSGYIAEQKRVNPESLYRKLYWTYQFKLFEGIENANNPKVLIVNDGLESEKLHAYARSKGYFIPDTRASLARQLELLHTHRSTNKLIIVSFQTLDKVISSNYMGALDFIWDSFLLQEKLQMIKDKYDVSVQLNDEQKEDDYQTDINLVKKDYDLFDLIKLHKPLIDFYYKMLNDNNRDSRLFLCDTRLTDYFGIERSLNLGSKSVQMWVRESDYDIDNEIAAEFFPSSEQNIDTDFNIDEAKEILRQLFLPLKDNGERSDWHDYQKPCLNDILPAKKDLLISLPTGAGKSLLFQGPALFRSAFTSKMSIVISPLRALMQDQVDTLWNKGFYSNVEFLSGDKSHVEIRDIYRRISGGEITLLYITPERFRSRSFENCLLTRLDVDNGLEYIVFDEAHCISQWGQEFRPDYLNAGKKVAGYSNMYQMRKLLFSATISEQVFEEISIIMPGVTTVENAEKNYNPVRDHIKMDFKHNVVEENRLLEISNYLKSGDFNPDLSRAIIFVKSRKKAEECSLIMSDNLKEVFGLNCSFAEKVGAFHAGMDAEDRKDTYEKFKNGDVVVLFATKAFGMGMDIPNIHFVTHYSPPGTFEDFLQEVGRAGRNEKQRLEAGFNNLENPIKTLCLTANNDFAKLKDQLHESRISWHEVKEVKEVLEDYVARFKSLIPDDEIPVAVPFNLYSTSKGSTKEDLDNKFRIALHWLERLERIKLGYFTITHLEFEATSLNKLEEKIKDCPGKDSEKVCKALLELKSETDTDNKVVQFSIAALRNITKLSLENLFTALIKAHSAGIIKLLQDVVIEPTKIRLNETNFCRNLYRADEKYPAIRVVFALANKILESIPPNSSRFFEGEDLDSYLKDAIAENINFRKLPWSLKEKIEDQIKECEYYIKDIVKKRSKHAFTVIRLLGKTKHDTKMEKVTDGNRKISIKQSVFNGYHKKEEWVSKIRQIENDSIRLLDYIAKKYFEKNEKNFNWPDIISELKLNGNVQYLSDLLFILSVFGYSKTGGLLPTGIEVFLSSIEAVNESDLQSIDKKIFNEFEETRKVRELKLISLEVLAGFQKSGNGNNPNELRKKQDTFIKKYFAAYSLESLLNLLQEELPPNDPLLVKWRGDAIKVEEERLNVEQRKVYDTEPNQNISVMAGPGSGKTHTLTLRVARLVHEIGVQPEEILVLAYNRAVVSELKERLGKLFNELGYGNLAKRIKIYTFHGLAKRYCLNDVNGKPFDEWEKILLRQLKNAPGQIMNQLAPLKHILVDEFQDINNIRINILNELQVLTEAYLFIIGDPNQSIYGYERIKEQGSMSPWPYYKKFDQIFKPTQFELFDNHRSYPDILNLASQILTLPEEHQHLIPRPTRIPEKGFTDYAQIIDCTNQNIEWWNQIPALMMERVGERQVPYKQIAILFRTNNEVYSGFQRVKGLDLKNIRIRIQGSLPYEFFRIRENHAVILFLKENLGKQIPIDFRNTLRVFIENLILQYPNWNDFYIRLMHALVLEYLDEQDDVQTFNSLLDFISELAYKDDGQLFKIYEKHINKVSDNNHQTEIVLTTMHKVKGLEFDAVIIPPSFSNLPLKSNEHLSQTELTEQLDEEKRLAFVAYTRARYRLIVYKGKRELSLQFGIQYQVPEDVKKELGIPVTSEIKKLNIGWAAGDYIFSKGRVNEYIKMNVKSGDFVSVRSKIVPYNGSSFTVHEVFKDGSDKAIGQLSKAAGDILKCSKCNGFVVNEVVIWSYEDTLKFDKENPGNNYAAKWCEGAKNQGYIYLVDFAGYGNPVNV